MTAIIAGFLLGLTWLQLQAQLPTPMAQHWLLGAVILLALATWLLRRGPASSRGGVRTMRFLLLCLCACLCAVLWGSWRAERRLAEIMPAAMEGEDIALVGTVASLPQRTERGWRFEFAVEQPPGLPSRVSLAWYERGGGLDAGLPPLHVGERWQLVVRLRRPHGNLNPHGFDYEAWLLERGIGATGYVRPRTQQQRLDDGGAYPVERWREAIRARFERALTRSDSRTAAPDLAPYAGVLVALAIGDQQAVPRSQWDVFARTGITHLVSISGLHITMLAGLAYALLSFFWRRFPVLMLHLPAQRAAVLGGLVAAVAYSALAGFAVPAQRTLYMLAVAAAALWMRRNPAPRTVLMLALLCVLIVDPWAVMAPGFWLSFGAVALLLYVGSGRLREGHWLRLWTRAQWAMCLGMLPLLLVLFQQFSLISPLANAVAIPLVSLLITPLVLLAAVPGLEFLLHPAHALMTGLMWLMQVLADLPFSAWQQAAAPFWLIALALLGALWMLLPRGFPARWLGLLPVLALLLWTPPRPGVGEVQATVLDVGQGLAVHVQTHAHDLLFDTGPAYSDEADSGNRIILPYLRAAGVAALDLLVITHADADHSGGAASVVEGMAVRRMLSSVPFENMLAALPLAHAPCMVGQSWNWDGVDFELLHPQAADYEQESFKSNDMSCVLKISSPGGSLLLTGDIEARSEARLLAQAAARLRADILLVPHHGSSTSSTPAFVAAVGAHTAIIPVGYRNRFRHPHPAVLDRYAGMQVYRTDRDGAVMVRYSADKAEITTARAADPRYWRP